MKFSPDLADIRFGCGLSPSVAAPQSVDEMLEGLRAPDLIAQRYPVENYTQYRDRIKEVFEIRRAQRKAETEERKRAIKETADGLVKQSQRDQSRWYGQLVSRWVDTPHGFRERLTRFWQDHFTAVGKTGMYRQAVQPYVEEAIRPNIAGRFPDLLVKVVTHPVMLQFLDQQVSTGPNSPFAQKKNRKNAGLNENLAREVLELHTLGVDGPYSQDDVRSLARLFTGMSFNRSGAYTYLGQRAEPGADTVVGKTYGGGEPSSRHIEQALWDLALHPATARHISWKLAVHFVADDPDPDLIEALTQRFLETGGNLFLVYETMLNHPAAWQAELRNVKPPFDYVASSCRALQVDASGLFQKEFKKARARLTRPLDVMGQRWLVPFGPDGWPEEDEAWITPQGLSARIRWAMAVPRLLGVNLPDPRVFVDDALGAYANKTVRFAANAAETRTEGIGLVLSAPAFQRR